MPPGAKIRLGLGLNKIGGQARAMVVTSGIERAIQYLHAFRDYLAERKSPHQAIVAFSGEHLYGGTKVTEGSLNGFPSSEIVDKIAEDPYRFLICTDKFQTGYDQPQRLVQALADRHGVRHYVRPRAWIKSGRVTAGV